MLRWEIGFFELPNVDDVAIQYQNFWLDASDVVANFFGVTTKCAQVQIAEDAHLDFSWGRFHVFKIPFGMFLQC